MKKAFTMVELIFVIVIIGILASVAIPKLSATRDDAIDSRDCKNLAICIGDMLSEYTGRETATKSESDACVAAEGSAKNSITVQVTSSDLTAIGAPARCGNLNTTYVFGGSRISL